ncbi:MAG TPA: short-chain fatty acyl-CoA regulator family protein, partial [Alicycliphilus sp.]|nr:short-chain fatty acyl-CoA regulator family protein [Alicycliphilus sp.]
AEALAAQAPRVQDGRLGDWLAERLRERHGVRVVLAEDGAGAKRSFEPGRRQLLLSGSLAPAQQAFQLATQLALLEVADTIDVLVDAPQFANDAASRKLARIGLANYFAGALLLPYGAFLQAAEALRYDIDLLQQRFGVGFETVCHRLSTLQRPGAPGVPFFFIRVDRAGNISKRQSATHFHFSRTGGTCPLWNVYEAFGQPGELQRQIACMPDGRKYLWIARTVSGGARGYGAPRKTFSVGLGCDIRHAPRLVYAQGLDLNAAATPIGMGCKVCERAHCPQRAFPYIGRALEVDEHQSRFAPYGFAQ